MKFEIGSKVLPYWSKTPHEVVAGPDSAGVVVLLDDRGRYETCHVDNVKAFVPTPQRYTVELRHPKRGERYAHVDTILTAYGYPDVKRFVIVNDHQS